MSEKDKDAPEKRISIVIPNYNKAETIGKCLEAAFASDYNNYEVVVVDDCSTDNSVEVIRKFPCTLIRLEHRSGTSKARNTGALNSSGEYIFFIDADCLLLRETLSIANRTISMTGEDVIVGGTYTRMPYDRRFFSIFQSVFVNYFETKTKVPDYIAAHAMIIHRETFRKTGGFPEDFMPIIEDVEYTHRLRRQGYELSMDPDIQVQHIFDFSFVRSLKNAYRKSKYWNMYSLRNRDVLADSGTASYGLKAAAALLLFCLVSIALWAVLRSSIFLSLLIPAVFLSVFINRGLLKAFYETGGPGFGLMASLYYIALYPLPVGMGGIAAIAINLMKKMN